MRALPSPLALVALLLGVGACASGGPRTNAAPSLTPPPAEGDPVATNVASGGGRLVQAGAPGEASQVIEATDIAAMGGVSYVQADVDFMRGMIPHHAQALEMTALVPTRAGSSAVRQMALRMEISQRDEIELMRRWLRKRGEEAPADETHAGHGGMGMMPGMLTPEQMAELRAAQGAEFDRLFLLFMIQHHEGAIVMVDRLFSTDGAGQESELFQFASHVDADQRAEIARMQQLLDRR